MEKEVLAMILLALAEIGGEEAFTCSRCAICIDDCSIPAHEINDYTCAKEVIRHLMNEA